MNNGDAETIRKIIQEEINKRPRLTKEEVREVVEDVVSRKFLLIGINTQTPSDIVRTQNAFALLFNLRRGVNKAIITIISATIIGLVGIVGFFTAK